MSSSDRVLVRDGTSQSERSPTALQPGYFHLDELAFGQLLAMAVDYARLLRYYNLNNAPEPIRDREQGVWEALFLTDEAPVIAQILTTDLRRIETDFRRFIENFQRDGQVLPADPAGLPTYQLAKKLDDWYDRLRTMDGAAAVSLSQQLGDMISPGLVRELQLLDGFLRRHDGGASEIPRPGLRAFWFDERVMAEGWQPPPSSGEGAAAERFLRGNFHAFYKAVALLKGGAAAALTRSLGSQAHSPAVGLYMAFLQLYGKVQGVANRFTERHLDFYYRDVLRFSPRGAVADSTFLLLAQGGTARHVPVPKGTPFSAGVDALGRDVVFRADRDVLVGTAQVADLRTLYFEHNDLISPERDFGFATGGRSGRGRLAQAASSDHEPAAWPLLGAPKPDARPQDEADALLGFAIASPILLLREGVRDINLTFDLELEPLPGAPTSTQPAAALCDWLQQLAEVTGTTVLDAFFKTFREMFRISLTTARGWHEVAEYLPLSGAVEPGRGGASLGIQLRLPPETDPITAYSAPLHADDYATDYATAHPIIRFTLNPTAYLYPYSLLARLVVSQIDIEVAVKGVRNVLLYNQLGQLDANTPFNPFGPVPMLGAYFIVGSAEIAYKRLNDLELDIEWGGLPTAGDGLASHYATYDQPYDDAQFQARVSVLKGGRWLPSEASKQPTTRLFAQHDAATRARDGAATPSRQTLSCQGVVPLARPLEPGLADEGYAYTAQAKDAFFKFTLSAPEYAFGHQEYPLLLTQVLTANARLKSARLSPPIPPPPYTPLISAISLNYRASASLNLAEADPTLEGGNEKLFHLHPFGVEAISPRTRRRVALVPGYDAAGNLFIGLEGGDPSGALSLFFQLRGDSLPSREAQPSEPSWSYLSDNRWKPLQPSRVLSDGTRGFLTSGIVELDLPRDISRGNSVMPAELYWLKVSVDRFPETLCSAYAVHAQALRVSRQLDGDAISYTGGELPAGTIKAPLVSLPGIVRIAQPVPSSGGRPPEAPAQFKARVSERLRHKNRATLAWDYERLILERFPQIYKAKCFPNMVAERDPAKRLRPGHLLIVVIPQQERESAEHMEPLLDRASLREIQEYVMGLASPFARIEVRNPDYEQIQVRCTVKYRTRAAGDQLQALNQAITDYLSPWRRMGHEARFGWRIRRHDLEAYIRALPNIDYVTNFSMLRVAERGRDRFLLDDTVTEGGEQLREIGPVYPWSIAVPFRQHAIETTDELMPVAASRTGIGEIEIDSNLILS